MKSLLKKLVMPVRWMLNLRVRSILATVLMLAALVGFFASPAIPLFRDFVIAMISVRLDGSPLPIDEIDYSGGAPVGLAESWGILTNSQWLVERSLEIIPYFSYDQLVTRTKLPQLVAFVPNADMRSFHVLGTTAAGAAVRINTRFLTTDRADMRDVYTTLIHELLHAQGRPFTYGGLFVTAEEQINVEAMTTAGTIEILAAVCNYRENEVACPTFWQEFGDLARTSLQVQMRGLGMDWLYQRLADMLFRDLDQVSRAHKALRFWENYPGELAYIQTAYGAYPWEKFVLPGLSGYGLPTATMVLLEGSEGWFRVVHAPFDDTREILGPLGIWAAVLTELHNAAQSLVENVVR